MRFVYIGEFNSSGRPYLVNKDHLTDESIGKTITQSDSNEINALFPERQRLYVTRPDWIKSNTLVLLAPSEIECTFIKEGAGYRNAFGYYVYNTENPPKSEKDIDVVNVFYPNASAQGSGGSMLQGDTMKLPYEVNEQVLGNLSVGFPTNYVFPSGKSIGFVIMANGWKGYNVNQFSPRFYTDPFLNPESADWLKVHTALVKTSSGMLVMGMEDIDRNKNYCDHDFNDLVVTLTLSNLSALSGLSYIDPDEETADAPSKFSVGYKKCFVTENDDSVSEVVVTLYIPEDSQVHLERKTGKTRTDRAYVRSIIGVKPTTGRYNSNNTNSYGKTYQTCHSGFDKNFVYNTGEWETSEFSAEPDNFKGIHYFADFESAAKYVF